MTLCAQFDRLEYLEGYDGLANMVGGDTSNYERGMIARRVAEWCGVSLCA